MSGPPTSTRWERQEIDGDNDVSLTMYAIDRLQPDNGPLQGGTEVLVFANHTREWSREHEMTKSIGCLFGVKGVPAVIVSSDDKQTVFRCRSPKHSSERKVTMMLFENWEPLRSVKRRKLVPDSRILSVNFLAATEGWGRVFPVHFTYSRFDTSFVGEPVCFQKANIDSVGDRNQFTLLDPQEIGITHHQSHKSIAPDCLFDDSSMIERNIKGVSCDMEYMSGGVAVGDFDNDGWPDLAFSRIHGSIVLYRNVEGKRFEDVTEQVGIDTEGYATNGLVWVDINNDGLLDLYAVSLGGHRNFLFVQQPDNTFVEEALERGAAMSTPHVHGGMSVAVGDFDNDGFADVHVTEWRPLSTVYTRPSSESPISSARLLRNLGKQAPGYFEDVTETAGVSIEKRSKWFHIEKSGWAFGSQFIDLDNDGWQDLIVAGDFGTTSIFFNNRNGTFVEVVGELETEMKSGVGDEQNAMGIAFADLDQNGFVDFYITGIQDEKKRCKGSFDWCVVGWRGNYMFFNNGNRTFQDRANELGIKTLQPFEWAWGASFIDQDHSGRQSLIVVNGFSNPMDTFEDDFNTRPNKFMRNVGTRQEPSFVDASDEVGFNSTFEGRAVVLLDFDNDGDDDIIVVNSGREPPHVYRNDIIKQGNWIRIKPFKQYSNQFVHGAKVSLWQSKDSPQDRPLVQFALSQSVLWGHSDYTVHFGISDPDVKKIHRIEVHFPATGVTRVLHNVPVNRTYVVRDWDGHEKNHEHREDIRECVQKMLKSNSEEMVAQTEVTKRVTKDSDNDDLLSFIDDDEEFDAIVQHVDPLYAESVQTFKEVLQRQRQYAESGKWRETERRLIENDHANEEYRTINAVGNNRKNPNYGASFVRLDRMFPASYEDGKGSPAGSDRPSPRHVSNVVFTQHAPIFSKRALSDMFNHFGQLLAHDIDFTSPLHSFRHGTSFPISVPRGDYFFDIDGTGKETIRFKRSLYDTKTGHSKDNPRQQINKITAFVDASFVYGSTDQVARQLRTFTGGKLKMTNNGLPIYNTRGIENDNPKFRDTKALGVAGDTRMNVQPGLVALHAVFLREHNRLADLLARQHPSWDDERIYQRARKIVSAIMQIITYNEYLPALFGTEHGLPEYTGYNDTECPDIVNEFSTAAFRFGHSMINRFMLRVLDNGTLIQPPLSLRETYFKPERMIREGGIESLLRGSTALIAQEMDVFMIDDLRNFLFGSSVRDGALDLASANIQRGRDHGLPSFVDVRKYLGLPDVNDFDDITSDPITQARLREAYGTVDKVDFFVGGLAEDHLPGASIGATYAAVLRDQFRRIRDGDRFFYLNDFTPEEIVELEKVKMSTLIKRNTAVKEIPDQVMFAASRVVLDAETASQIKLDHEGGWMLRNP